MSSRRPPVTITVLRLSGESSTFSPVWTHHSMRSLLDWVKAEMVPAGKEFKLLLGDMEIDPVLVGTVRPPHINHLPQDHGYFNPRRYEYPKVTMRRYGIWRDTTLTLVLM